MKNRVHLLQFTGQVKEITEIIYSIEFDQNSTLNSEVLEKIKILFKCNGQIMEQLVYDPNDIIISRDIYKYDKADRMIESNRYFSSSECYESGIFIYNLEGNIAENIIYDKNGISGKFCYLYNDKGYVSKEIYYKQGLYLDFKDIYRYDDIGNMVERNHYNINEILILHHSWREKYKYNNLNNSHVQ
jgi:hypothetical protein